MIVRSRQASLLLRGSFSPLQVPPDFLIPACILQIKARPFSSTLKRGSRIGALPVSVPTEVKLNLIDPPPPKKNDNLRLEPEKTLEIEGPLGKIPIKIPAFMTVDFDDATRKASVSVQDRKVKRQRQVWGTIRANIANHVVGVSEGHAAVLRMVGVGYRATLEPSASTARQRYRGQKFVNLKVGFTHPIELGVPRGMKCSIPQPTRILLEGIVKEEVNEFAAKIRAWRKPEPYKGKGIFVNGETIKLKAKKIK